MNSTGTQHARTAGREAVASSFGAAPAQAPNTLTREARLYAIAQIARRAGVSKHWSRNWRVDIDQQWATIHLDSRSRKKIVFPVTLAPDREAHSFLSGETSRAAWAYPPASHLYDSVPDFVVPFVGGKSASGLPPIFAASDAETVRFNFDLPAATLLTLTRAEEIAAGERDAHGRFPASAGIAASQKFLHRPIVDEYGFALEQALQCLVPQWSAERQPLRVKLSHDVDEIGIPFSLRSTVGHALKRRASKASFQDCRSLFTGDLPAYLQSVLEIAQLSTRYGLDSAFYWKASPAGKNDSGYDPSHRKVVHVLQWLNERGFENGVHPGYETFRSPHRLTSEVNALRQSIGTYELGGRQHYLRWHPESWRDWEACGLAYDSTVGFAEQIGFRAGTCIPYRPWLLQENREAKLLEIPLLVMDRTLGYYLKLSPQESFVRVLDCVARCREVGGVFTLLWHNDSLLDPVFGDLYSRLLEHLAGSSRFDWRVAD